jgi:hypothetical protein
MRRRFCIAWLVLAVGACTPAPSPPASIGRLQRAIIAGVADAHDPAVLVWEAHVPGETFEELCTAEVISPHVVLTAAHCTHDPGSSVDYHVSSDLELTRSSTRIAVDEVHRPDEFVNELAAIMSDGYDVAIGISRAGFTVPPISYNRVPLVPAYEKRQVRIVGYGLSDTSDDMSAGMRREGTAQLASISDKFVRVKGKRQTVCQGDSGGPALLEIAGKEAIVALSSYAAATCDTARGATSTNVAAYAEFIDRWVDRFDPPGQALLGETCLIDRDCASRLCGAATATASDGGTGDRERSFCTTACDPNGAAVCPAGYRCSDVDGDTFCMPAVADDQGGCAFGGGRPATGSPWLLVLAAAASSWTLRRRRLRS